MPDRTNTNKSFQGLMGMAMHGKVLNLSGQRSIAEDNWKRVIDSTIFRQYTKQQTQTSFVAFDIQHKKTNSSMGSTEKLRQGFQKTCYITELRGDESVFQDGQKDAMLESLVTPFHCLKLIFSQRIDLKRGFLASCTNLRSQQ